MRRAKEEGNIKEKTGTIKTEKNENFCKEKLIY